MTTLREAAQQALEALLTYEQYIQPLTNVFGGPRVPEEGSASAKVDAAITALRAALAEPVQEPPAWQWLDTAHFRKKIPAHATPAHWRPLFTAPPQRKPLTDEEIKACEKQAMADGALPFEQRVFFARAIEKAHGIE